jgi:DNA-binding transcriptional LysR family regulator
MNKENRNISLKQMRAFVAVAHAGSFTRAADQLFITQSALSALIRNLEAELDLRLLDRTTRRLELTDAGRELLQSLEHLLGDLDRITSDLREVHAIRRGRIRIGTTPMLASTLLPPTIRLFSERYPGITIRVMDDPAPQLLRALHDGDIDLFVATLDGDHPELEATDLLSDSMVLVCHRGHRFADAAEVAWSALRSEPLIAMRKGSGLRVIVDDVLRSLGGEVGPAQEVNHIATALAMVRAQMGVAILPAYSVGCSGSENGRDVHVVRLVAPVVERHVSLATLKQRTPSLATRAMMNHLLEHLRTAGAAHGLGHHNPSVPK